MKKLIAILLVLAMALSIAACGNTKPEETTEAPETTTVPETTGAPAANVPASALEILTNIWALFGDDEKFPIAGGNMEAGVMDAPGNYDMAYAENLPYTLYVTAEQLPSITEAATMVHMMNANTFTSGALRLAAGTDAAAFAQTLRDAIQNNQWICGFPEQLVIAVVGGEYVVVAFGVTAAMSPFATKLTEAYADANILFNEAIAG